FFTAEAVAGELACRLAEGDNAGARILAEMALPYYEGSTYLSDFQRAVDLYLKLAEALNRQGHPADALAAVEKAEAKAAAGRQYMDADAFNRGTGQRMLRHAAVARVRALAALGRHEDAFAALEAVKTSRIANLLGARIADDSARTDAASEREAVRLRIPWVETRLQAAEAAGDAEETERLRGRLGRDVERLAWLDRAVEFVSPENLNYPAVHPGDLAALRAVLPAETLFLECAVDIYGAVAVAVGADFVEARALGLNETAALTGLRTVRDALAASADPAAPLAALSAPLLDPCADRLAQARRVALCPDEVLSPLPWPLMAVGGAPLGQTHVLSFAESAGLLLKALEKPAVKAARLRAFLPAAAPGDAAGLPGGDHVFGVEATLTRLLEGAGPEDLVYLSAKVNLTPPDPMLCPVLLGGDGAQGETPPARILGLNLPAAAVMLDWTPEPAGAALRPDLVSVTAEALRHAGAPSVILTLWPVAPAVAREYLTAFLAAQAGADRASAARAAAEALRAAHPESPDWAAFRLTGDFR
ncbi:MAG TPA: CHAT domain-containing protein, partial [Candidatus Hydrogenedentes bacterium]|nr:CHAT domain-containing protein [Candidatus Hydrogenedentota bacterium]